METPKRKTLSQLKPIARASLFTDKMINEMELEYTDELFEIAVENGRIRNAKMLLDKGVRNINKAFERACYLGGSEILEYIKWKTENDNYYLDSVSAELIDGGLRSATIGNAPIGYCQKVVRILLDWGAEKNKENIAYCYNIARRGGKKELARIFSRIEG